MPSSKGLSRTAAEARASVAADAARLEAERRCYGKNRRSASCASRSSSSGTSICSPAIAMLQRVAADGAEDVERHALGQLRDRGRMAGDDEPAGALAEQLRPRRRPTAPRSSVAPIPPARQHSATRDGEAALGDVVGARRAAPSRTASRIASCAAMTCVDVDLRQAVGQRLAAQLGQLARGERRREVARRARPRRPPARTRAGRRARRRAAARPCR